MFPSALKTDQKEVSNYRPMSILPAISKVIEKTVAEQLRIITRREYVSSKGDHSAGSTQGIVVGQSS